MRAILNRPCVVSQSQHFFSPSPFWRAGPWDEDDLVLELGACFLASTSLNPKSETPPEPLKALKPESQNAKTPRYGGFPKIGDPNIVP